MCACVCVCVCACVCVCVCVFVRLCYRVSLSAASRCRRRLTAAGLGHVIQLCQRGAPEREQDQDEKETLYRAEGEAVPCE